MASKKWTDEELTYLDEQWGSKSIAAIARNLGRSVNGVKIKAVRRGLGSHLHSGTCITFNELLKVLGQASGYRERLRVWTEKGLKIKTHKVDKCSFRVVDIEDFWKFAENNRDLFDFSRFEKNSLGIEPDWVDAKRKADTKKCRLVKTHNEAWTPAEDSELIRLLKMHRYGYAELEQRLRRTAGAIQRRVIDLNLKERPVKAYNHNKWTEEQVKTVIDMILSGNGYSIIAIEVAKSTKAVKGKVYALFGSENLDKVRERMEKYENHKNIITHKETQISCNTHKRQ